MKKPEISIKRDIIVPIIVSVLCLTIIMIIVNALRFDVTNVLYIGVISLALGAILLDILVEKEKELRDKDKKKINSLIKEGYSSSEIAEWLGKSESTIIKQLNIMGYDTSSEELENTEKNVSENKLETCSKVKVIEKLGLVVKSILIGLTNFLITVFLIIFLLLWLIADGYNGNIKVSIDIPELENTVMNDINNNDLESIDTIANIENKVK